MDKLVLVLSAAAQRVDFAKAVRIVDASNDACRCRRKSERE